VAGSCLDGVAGHVETGTTANDDVHLLVAVLDLVVRDEQQLAGIALVGIDPEGSDAEVLPDCIPAMAEAWKLTRCLLISLRLFRRTVA
jgi:hypothetical protein